MFSVNLWAHLLCNSLLRSRSSSVSQTNKVKSTSLGWLHRFKVKTQKSFSIHFGEEEEKVPATPRKTHPEEKEGENIPFYSSPSACVKNSFVHFLEKLSIRFSPYSHESIIKSRHIFSTKEETSAQLKEEKGEADKSSRRIEKRRKEEKKKFDFINANPINFSQHKNIRHLTLLLLLCLRPSLLRCSEKPKKLFNNRKSLLRSSCIALLKI